MIQKTFQEEWSDNIGQLYVWRQNLPNLELYALNMTCWTKRVAMPSEMLATPYGGSAVKSSHHPGGPEPSVTLNIQSPRDTNQGSRHRPWLPFKLLPPFMPNFSLFHPETPSSDIFGPISRGSEHGTRHTQLRHQQSPGSLTAEICCMVGSEFFKVLKGFEGLVWRRLFSTG